MFEWNKEKFAFNVLDADMNEKVLREEKNLWKNIEDYEADKDGRLDAEGIKTECGIIDSFFAAVFGADAPGKMFDTPHDLASRTKALKKLYAVQKGQFEAHSRRVQELSALVIGEDETDE